MKARDYLVSKGLAKAGRGKFSNDAKAALNAALASGKTFSDWPKVDATPVAKSDKTVKSESSPSDTPYLFPDEYRFPEKEYDAFIRENGKKRPVSLRECCSRCRVSLVNHSCDQPAIYGNVAVTIVRKKGL